MTQMTQIKKHNLVPVEETQSSLATDPKPSEPDAVCKRNIQTAWFANFAKLVWRTNLLKLTLVTNCDSQWNVSKIYPFGHPWSDYHVQHNNTLTLKFQHSFIWVSKQPRARDTCMTALVPEFRQIFGGRRRRKRMEDNSISRTPLSSPKEFHCVSWSGLVLTAH